jgi:hypothetical protein
MPSDRKTVPTSSRTKMVETDWSVWIIFCSTASSEF